MFEHEKIKREQRNRYFSNDPNNQRYNVAKSSALSSTTPKAGTAKNVRYQDSSSPKSLGFKGKAESKANKTRPFTDNELQSFIKNYHQRRHQKDRKPSFNSTNITRRKVGPLVDPYMKQEKIIKRHMEMKRIWKKNAKSPQKK